MPILKRANASLYYEESGAGEPLILIHGFSVNSLYWSKTGVTSELARCYRVIAMDLRGHGRTVVEGEPKGFAVATLGDDIEALADALGITRFHLLGHSTGGMVAVHYAMRGGERLSSLLLMGTGPATAFGHSDPQRRQQALHLFAAFYEQQNWDQIFAHLRRIPGPLLYRLDQLPEQGSRWAVLEEISRLNDPRILAAFARTFFTDPDLHVEELRQIPCPTLVLTGEYDKLFLQSSALLAREIPHAQQLLLTEVGHMTALEAPGLTSQAILAFLNALPRNAAGC